MKAPGAGQPSDLAGIEAAGARWWPLAMARELDDAILTLRTNELDIGTWILKTEGEAAHVLACDAALKDNAGNGLVREVIGMLRRTTISRRASPNSRTRAWSVPSVEPSLTRITS